jgi:preprotein translocase subunit SecA
MIFGSANDRTVRSLQPFVARINALEPQYVPLDGDGLRACAAELRGRAEKGEPLDALLPEAFALVREAAKRTLGQRHYDVQLIGGMVLHQGKIAEMKTGEGKTLVATLPAFLNALPGKGVHIVTVNDFLATRDAEWMGRVFRYLGMSVGCNVHGMNDEQKRAAYQSDITYGQNNEFGFDYLRDNMKRSLSAYYQRELNYAIIDEVDSILIDEARTPLIISGPVLDDPSKFSRIDRIIPNLRAEEHFTVDEKQRSIMLTEDGVERAEQLLGVPNLYAPEAVETLHVVQNALRAHVLYKKDVDYVVKDDQIIIVDEFTGRLMEGRRWSDGLHQAVEAKEQVRIQNESQTYASITFQNYFRMYGKLGGMTGTADTEAVEFHKIYKLDVVVIPTHRPMVRKDLNDVVYATKGEKWNAVADEIAERHESGQPVLVGTIAIETSELLSKRLKNRGIPHDVLNAKHHGREAQIIAQAGRLGAVTISTNMAGRGTDIVLGGNAEMLLKARGLDPRDPAHADELAKLTSECERDRQQVLAAGGLFVLGTERHESRRIDNQLRGRSGRQGDPGGSRFFLSLEDDLLRIFGGERVQRIMQSLGMEEGEAIEHRLLSRQIARAQAKVEARNFDVRKHLLEYDDVMNRQRETIYTWRRHVLSNEHFRQDMLELARQLAGELVNAHVPQGDIPDMENLLRALSGTFHVELDPAHKALQLDRGHLSREEALPYIHERIEARLDAQIAMFEELAKQIPEGQPIPTFDLVARNIMLEHIDAQWKDHLLVMDHLKEGIGLRGYGGKDPKREYQSEGYTLFGDMDRRIRERVVYEMFNIVLRVPSQEELLRRRAHEEARQRQLEQALRERHASANAPPEEEEPADPTVRKASKVGRNDPCPCGSGQKYKKCHGQAG